MTTRLPVFAAALACACTAALKQAPADARVSEPAAVLSVWFDHIQRDQLDSLRPLLAPEFLFVSDGARLDADAFVGMIKGLGISHPRVRLSNIVSHQSGSTAYLVYDRLESFESHGASKSVPETGTMVLRRIDGRWLIALWTTTSPPH